MNKNKFLFKNIVNKFPLRKQSGLNFNKKRRKINFPFIGRVTILVGEIAIAIILGFLCAHVFFSSIIISGISMEPTLIDGNRVLINRFFPTFELEYQDVIAFESGSGSNTTINVKRIVGLPGDTVVISSGQLIINGERQENKDYMEAMENPGIAKNEVVLSKGEYFVLGDNRNNSEDSRYDSIGIIKKRDIVGKVWFCVSPSNIGGIN